VSEHRQQPLPLSPSLVPTYDSFYLGENRLAVEVVQQLGSAAVASQVYLWGQSQSGKTHLLQAACNEFIARGQRSFYVSLKEPMLSSDLLESLDGYGLLAIDDIDAVAAKDDWEKALFNLINFSREQSGKILFSASGAPATAGWQLPDLKSRLGWGPVVKMEVLSDTDVRQAFLFAINRKGLQMPDEAVDYLLKRHSRDLGSLLQTVALLDRESLAAGRARITIPFLKSCLSVALSVAKG